jgi:hypothetical protein
MGKQRWSTPAAEEVAEAVERHPEDVLHNFCGQDPLDERTEQRAGDPERPVLPTDTTGSRCDVVELRF